MNLAKRNILRGTWAILGFLMAGVWTSRAADMDALCADRTAIEHVYYEHRLGTKPPFDTVSPPSLIRHLVAQDLGKEAVLKKVYGVEISDSALAAEVQRIDRTTHSPEMLAEIKAALGNDPQRFASAFAKPIVVDRELRARFENDDALHASNRRFCAAVRQQVLAASTRGVSAELLLGEFKEAGSNHISEITWQLSPPPPAQPATPTQDELEIKRRFGPNAQILSAPPTGNAEAGRYFSELPDDLQRVLRVQLRQPGDVSAVIETAGGFSLYLAELKNSEQLSVAVLSLPKRDYDQWVADQIQSVP
jgi:hypothetical protein